MTQTQSRHRTKGVDIRMLQRKRVDTVTRAVHQRTRPITSEGQDVGLDRKIVLVTPNISEQMGGEAIKAYQFLRHLVATGRDVTVITHQRSAKVMAADFPDVESVIIKDSIEQVVLWRTYFLSGTLASLFFFYARRPIKRILKQHPDAIFHYLCPVSPILPRYPVRGATNILGPLTGNIYYPPALRASEPVRHKFARTFHNVSQRVLGFVDGDKRVFRRVLVSGGERTRRSLSWAGCPADVMRDVVDSGVSAQFGAHPLIRHEGTNMRFMTSGRLVPHKGVQLTIEALQHVRQPIIFDVYGDGDYGPQLRELAERLGVTDKVRFLGWLKSHDDLIGRMADYRGYVVPSLAEANGIVVQEAMMAGLPVICLDWGGPAMLADARSAIMIAPDSHDGVVRQIAKALDELAVDPDRANALTSRAREIAEHRFTWDSVAQEWLDAYELD